VRPRLVPTLTVLLGTALAPAAQATTVWSGPALAFEKPAFASASDPAHQDRLTDGVALTRGLTQGLYNATVEAVYNASSPAGTEWAWTLNNPGLDPADLTASHYASLQFDTWITAHGRNPPATVGIPGVLHLLDEDIYLDITFTRWGAGGGGGGAFAYTRSTIPEPAGGALLGLGLVGLALRPRRGRGPGVNRSGR